MSRLRRGLGLALAIWLAAAGLACAAPDRGGPQPAARDPPRRILVMLRLPPEHLRPNADYGGVYGDEMGRSARRRIAGRLAHEFGLRLMDDWPMPVVGVDCFVMSIPDGRSPEEMAARLAREPAVAWSQPLNIYRAEAGAATHNDPLYPVQPAAREWRLAELHEVATGRTIRVAVIDSMVEKNHPDLAGQVAISENFAPDHGVAPEQHGTAVAGVISARADNGIGIAGIAPGARLMALRACWQLPPASASATICDSLSLAKALDFAISHNAQIINLSLSGPSDLLLGKLLDVAETRRISVVAAFDRDLPGGGFPASHAGVVAVADESWGPPPAGVYSAPGRDVPTTTLGGHWSLVTGSSFAAAHVSGLIALLREGARPDGGSLTLVANQAGGGVIDACATLLRPRGPCDCRCAVVEDIAAFARR